jgi:hypothetical protein
VVRLVPHRDHHGDGPNRQASPWTRSRGRHVSDRRRPWMQGRRSELARP